VYAVGHAAPSRDGRELAAVLGCGPRALLSHRSAGPRWGLLTSSASRIEVTAPRAHKPRAGLTLHRSRSLTDEDRAEIDGIPVTSVARTLVDLADVLSDPQLERAVHEAEVRRIFDLEEVDRILARVPGRRGRHRLRRVLDAYRPEDHAVESEAERRFLELCRRHALPEPERNALVEGRRVDFFWPDALLAVEVDGAAAHHTRRAFQEDRARDRALAAAGVQVLRVTWQDLARDASLADAVHTTLAGRWGGGGPR
jgi:very-short-patch-repair endonuclease